jgi:protein gp37
MHKDWVRSIRDQCINASVRFHFKQWGGTNKKRAGRTLDGRTWDEWRRTKKRRTRAQSKHPLEARP